MKDEPDFQEFFPEHGLTYSNDPNLNDAKTEDLIKLPNSTFSSVDPFEQQHFSTSETSLSEQQSPRSYVQYDPMQYSPGSSEGILYSPGSGGSMDSGLPQSIDSPQLSPDSISGYYNLEQGLTSFNEIPYGKEQLSQLIQQEVEQALLQKEMQNQLQQNQLQQQLQQQQLLLLVQQQKFMQQKDVHTQQNTLPSEQSSPKAATKNNDSSQLRRMLAQTKQTFFDINSR